MSVANFSFSHVESTEKVLDVQAYTVIQSHVQMKTSQPWTWPTPVVSHICCRCSVTQSCLTQRPGGLSKPGFPVLHYLLEFAQTHVHWVDNAIKSSHPLLLLLLPSVFPSMRVFSNELALCIRWPKFWNFSISPSNEFQGWFPLGLTGLIFLLSKGLSRVLSSTTIWKH